MLLFCCSSICFFVSLLQLLLQLCFMGSLSRGILAAIDGFPHSVLVGVQAEVYRPEEVNSSKMKEPVLKKERTAVGNLSKDTFGP